MDTRNIVRRFEGTISTGLGGSADTILQVEQGPSSANLESIWLIIAFFGEITVNGGAAAATYDFRLSETVGWTNADLSERYTQGGIAVANRIKHFPSTGMTIKLDANGRAHLRFAGNAGVGHTGTYRIDFMQARGR